jgi:predicted RNase H-like HicB family nuclease
MPELVFEAVRDSDGGYWAECLTENIFAEGNTWDELRKRVAEASAAFFFDRPRLSEFASTSFATRLCPSPEDPLRHLGHPSRR